MSRKPPRLLVLYDFAVDDHPFTRSLRSQFAGEVVERGVHYRAGHRLIDKAVQKAAIFSAAHTALHDLPSFDAIICWQQDIGLLIGGLSRLLRVQGTSSDAKVCLLMFIAPERRRQGLLRRAIAWALSASHIVYAVCYGTAERELYTRSFPEVSDKFAHSMLSEEYPDIGRFPVTRGATFVAAGRSNRDYRFLLDFFAARPHLQLEIVNDDPSLLTDAPNITVHRNVYRDDYMRLLAGARAVIIPFNDPVISAGQMVFLHALQLGKPAICTRSACLDGYLIDGINGLIVEKNAESLDAAITRLMVPQVYERISIEASADYLARFSFKRQARDILELMQLPRRFVSPGADGA
ncbi:glycosyltransferase [Sphingomonas faeni]|uniref:glycosyltransferase n=1 Tax=Sphingomonas faeni TaxID=185950 RepID=UPI00334E940B